jgi:hypothetical protein
MNKNSKKNILILQPKDYKNCIEQIAVEYDVMRISGNVQLKNKNNVGL